MNFPSPETLTSSERQQAILALRMKRLDQGELSEDETRYAVRLLRAERVARVGSGPAGSKQKAQQTQAALSLDDF